MKINAERELQRLMQTYEDNYAQDLGKILNQLNGMEMRESRARLRNLLEALGETENGTRSASERQMLYNQLEIIAEKSKTCYEKELVNLSEQMVNIFKALNRPISGYWVSEEGKAVRRKRKIEREVCVNMDEFLEKLNSAYVNSQSVLTAFNNNEVKKAAYLSGQLTAALQELQKFEFEIERRKITVQ